MDGVGQGALSGASPMHEGTVAGLWLSWMSALSPYFLAWVISKKQTLNSWWRVGKAEVRGSGDQRGQRPLTHFGVLSIYFSGFVFL